MSFRLSRNLEGAASGGARTVQNMSEHDEDPALEVGPPTPEERVALAAIIREHGGGELDADTPMLVGRVFTADDLRAEAEAAAEQFERGES